MAVQRFVNRRKALLESEDRLGSLGIVFVTASREELQPRVAEAWYRSAILLLGEHHPLRACIAVVPFVARKDAAGALALSEGVKASRYRA